VKQPTQSDVLDFTEVMPRLDRALSSAWPVLRLKNILVPIDFSEGSLRALPYASFLARQFGCQVTLLYVAHLNVVGEERGVPRTRFLEEMKARAKQVLDKVAPSVGPTVRTVVRVGEPVSEVLKEAVDSDIDLIVLGQRRSNRFWQRWFPTAEGKIVRRAPCPTLVAA